VEGVAAAIRDLAVVDPPAPILPRPLQYLSIPECAKRLSCSKQFIYRLIHDGLLRSMKDSIWRVSEQDLEAYAESQRYNPKSTSR
jgi:excisionase family DNA binding protein